MDTINEILVGFQAELYRQDKSQLTIKNYISDIRLFAKWRQESYGEEFTPSSIAQREIIEYRSYLLTVRTSSPTTVNRRLASLNKFFDWCKYTKQVRANPCDSVKTITVSEPGPRALDVKSLRRLLREVHVHGSKRDIAIIELMAGTAIRVGELVMLSVSDAEISDRKGTVHIRNGKGKASRQVPLNVDVRNAINDWIAVRPTTNSNYLFIGQRGERLTTNGVWRIVKKFGQMAGIPNIQVHDLRRTVLTRLLREFKNDYSLVCSISGHKNMKTLMIYTKPTSDDLAVAMDGLAFTGK
jgi:site-specific recombinase XerD